MCSIADPPDGSVFPQSCSCTPTASGVGGTVNCDVGTPAVPAISFPAIPIVVGTEITPCGTPASVSIHAYIDLPGSTNSDLNTLIQAAVDGSPELSFNPSTNVISIQATASIGTAETIRVPVFMIPMFSLANVILEAEVCIVWDPMHLASFD